MKKSEEEYLKKRRVRDSVEDEDEDSDDFRKKNQPSQNKATPVLDSFSRDLTKMAEEGKLDPVVGRLKEIERVSQILSRRKKNNPILIGEPGTGKSSIAEGLAQKIVERKCSRVLFDKRIVMLDIAAMVSGTKYRGQFEERVKALMAELEKTPDVILFIDEIHTIVGAGGASGSLDASNMFKPALARGEIQMIGATTLDEYRKYIEKDGALERRFQKVMVEPATPEETIQILNNIKDKYEFHHHVNYTDEAIKSCVELTSRYITDRHLPDKAIDALDESGSRVHISNIIVPKDIIDIEQKISDIRDKKAEVVKNQRYEEAAKLRDAEKQLLKMLDDSRRRWDEESKDNRQTVTEENVAEVVSMMTGIPLKKVNENESKKLSTMAKDITGKVIGQDEAVKAICKSIQRSRIGLKDPNKPIFVGMCIGNTGVGKTQLAKELAKHLFESEDSLVRLDMSEFGEKIAVTRILGSAPGYVGHEEGSAFLNKIRTKPYSVILLDEIEKAHPDIFNIFLQMFDDGQMTDSHGRKVYFKNSVILMTSNVGTKILKDFGTAGVGFKTKSSEEKSTENARGILEKALKTKFPPEFLNRVDDIIYFRDLDKQDIFKILDIEISELRDRAQKIGYSIEIDDLLKEKIYEVGYDPNFGARPLKRAARHWIDDYLTEYILENNPDKSSTIYLSYDKDTDVTTLKSKKSRKSKKED